MEQTRGEVFTWQKINVAGTDSVPEGSRHNLIWYRRICVKFSYFSECSGVIKFRFMSKSFQ